MIIDDIYILMLYILYVDIILYIIDIMIWCYNEDFIDHIYECILSHEPSLTSIVMTS